MGYERLVKITGEMNDCLQATLTHLNRFKILIDKLEVIEPELRLEFGEFFIDWGTNITRLGNLYKEQIDLTGPLIVDLLEATKEQIAELKGDK